MTLIQYSSSVAIAWLLGLSNCTTRSGEQRSKLEEAEAAKAEAQLSGDIK
jgi:hypothetical protein